MQASRQQLMYPEMAVVERDCHVPTIGSMLALGVPDLGIWRCGFSAIPAQLTSGRVGNELRLIELNLAGGSSLAGIAIGSELEDRIETPPFRTLRVDCILPQVWIGETSEDLLDIQTVTDRSWVSIAINLQLNSIYRK